MGQRVVRGFETLVATGRKEEALAFIDKSFREHSNFVTTLNAEPALDPLRDDPRFQEILRWVGFAQR